MKRIILSLLFASLCTLVFSQKPDTTTLEKKARYHIDQISDNKIRAITPLHLRKAFNAVSNLALGNVTTDDTTLPKPTALSSAFPVGISMFRIREQDGWPFNGTLLVEKRSDYHAVQTITSHDSFTSSAFIDQRKRTNYHVFISGEDKWSPWDVISVSYLTGFQLIKPGESMMYSVNLPGVTVHHRIKRINFSTNPSGIIWQLEKITDGTITVRYTNYSQSDITLPLGSLRIYAEY